MTSDNYLLLRAGVKQQNEREPPIFSMLYGMSKENNGISLHSVNYSPQKQRAVSGKKECR